MNKKFLRTADEPPIADIPGQMDMFGIEFDQKPDAAPVTADNEVELVQEAVEVKSTRSTGEVTHA
jgi:hypothetical protein